MLIVLISWIVNVDGVDSFGCWHRWQLMPMISPMYRYLGRYIATSGLDSQYFPIVLIIDGIETSTTAIMSMSMSQPIASMAPSAGVDDSIEDASMADF
jgi:hypothetical protein